MPIVTISRQYASGGSEVAERVARALGWHLYDNAVVDEVAARLGISPAEVSAREERMPSLAERLASAISLAAPEVMPTVGDAALPPSEERIVEVTGRVMEEAVQAGPAVIVGRGAQCLLATRSDAIHVFCYAPLDALAAYAVTNLGVKPDEARKNVAEMNARSEEYVKRHWKRDWRDVANYHLCVNTAWLGLDGAAELVTRVAQERFG
ncbi:MAG TPA: cytidylate kinase-like family protein [Gemmatimonadaceae bacterium]